MFNIETIKQIDKSRNWDETETQTNNNGFGSNDNGSVSNNNGFRDNESNKTDLMTRDLTDPHKLI